MKQYSYKNAPKTQKAKVQHLYIETDRGTGLLPQDVFEYTNIEILSVRLLKAIPPEIAKLKKLRKLDIAFWGGGILPEYIGSLTNLEEINIRVVDIPLGLPSTLSNLKQLKKLTFYDCKLENFPKVLLEIPQLVKLEMSANKFTDLNLPDQCYWSNLEVLDLRTNGLVEIPKWVYQHKSLKNLFIPNNKLKALPAELANLNQLEKLTVDNNQIENILLNIKQLKSLQLFNWFENPLGWIHPFVFQLDEQILDFKLFWRQSSKQSVKDVLSIKKALLKADLLNDVEVVQAICILLSDEIERKKTLSNEVVLVGYSVRNAKVRNAVIDEITSRLNVFNVDEFKEGSELLVLGTTIKKKSDLKVRLKELGIHLVTKRTTKTSHVILGKNIKKTDALLDNELIILSETELNHFLDEVAPAYLLEEEQSENTANLKSMLLTLSEENVSVALELLKSGGVPKDLMTTLFFVHKFSTDSKIVRKTKNLLTLNASDKLLEALKIRFNFKQNRVSFFDAKAYLEKVCTQTEINTLELLQYAFEHYNNKYPFSNLYTETISNLPEQEQKEAAITFWKNRVADGKLVLQEGDWRIISYLFDLDIVEVLEGRHYPVTNLASYSGGAKMKRLKKLILEYKREEIRLPKDLGTLENLEELDFTHATFRKEGWAELQQLKKVKKLTYRSDLSQIPPEIFDLKPLKTLILDGPNMELNLPIQNLQVLEEIEVLRSSMLGADHFINALKALPHLKKVKLHKALDTLYHKTNS